MEYEIVGHGHFGETWGIEKGIIMGRPDDDGTWAKLDDMVFDRAMSFSNGVALRVSISFVDEGGHFTQEVRRQCRADREKRCSASRAMVVPIVHILHRQKSRRSSYTKRLSAPAGSTN